MRYLRRNEVFVRIVVIILTIIAYLYIKVTYPLDFDGGVFNIDSTNVAPTPEYFDTSTSNPPINDTIKKTIKKYNPPPYPDSNYILRPYNRYPSKIKSPNKSEYKVILASDKQSDDRINEKKERRNAFIKFVLSVLLLIILVYIIIPLIIV